MFRHLIAATLIFAVPVLGQQNQPSKSKTQPPTRISKPPAPKPGETPPAKPTTPPAKPQPTAPIETVTLSPGAVEMAQELFRLDAAGLTMNLPVDAVAQITAAANTVSAKITPKGATEETAESAWLISIQNPRSRDKMQTPESVATTVMQQLQKAVGVVDRSQTDREGNVVEKLLSTKATIVEPVKSVVVKAERPEFERPAARFYIRLPREDKNTAIIRGYTIFQTAPGEFVTFDLATPEPNFVAARPLYEASIATARFFDAATLSSQRGAAIEAGINFLAKLANPEYDAAIATLSDQWYRLSKPAPGGAERDSDEVAYRRIRAKRGARGEIDPTAKPDKWGLNEREQGIVVRVDARYLQDGLVVDLVGVYWMSSDAKNEAWSLQQAIRDPKRRTPSVVTETGAREGSQMSVAISGSGEDARRIKPDVPKSGYVTQVQSLLLPTLLAQGQVAGEYGFYAYQPQNERIPITMRRDLLAHATDGSSNWILTSQQSEDRATQVSTYNEKGAFIQTVLTGQKTVWTPTTLQKLAEIWQAKGLPMN